MTDIDVEALVARALAEDLGEGDWTTLWTVPAECQASARIISKDKGVLAGTEIARSVLAAVDPELHVDFEVDDGTAVHPGQTIATLEGRARSILSGERVALNFLQRLSGVASLTRDFVDAVAGTGARILDTRKTTPGLRTLEKGAVRAGGGESHRSGLYDMVLIKENHIQAAGGIRNAVEAVAAQNERGLLVEVETTNLHEVEEALALPVDRILLDNMSLDLLREAVARIRHAPRKIETEASGGVTLETVRAIAQSGVDFISVGALTHSAPALDLSLLILSRLDHDA